ncbi:MAG: DUF3846 domain-containing protein [Bacillota bacterium]|jgi:hypothetical protein
MRVLIIDYDGSCYSADIPNCRRILEKIVMGRTETSVHGGICFITNSDSEYLFPESRRYAGRVIRGPFIVSGWGNDGEYRGLTDEELREWYHEFA